MSVPEKPIPKKLYEPPVCVVYGSVQDLTQKIVGFEGGDGGRAPRNKTSIR